MGTFFALVVTGLLLPVSSCSAQRVATSSSNSKGSGRGDERVHRKAVGLGSEVKSDETTGSGVEIARCVPAKGLGALCGQWMTSNGLKEFAECGPKDCTYEPVVGPEDDSLGYLTIDYGYCDSSCGTLGVRGLRATSGEHYSESGRCTSGLGNLEAQLLVLRLEGEYWPLLQWQAVSGTATDQYYESVADATLVDGWAAVIFEHTFRYIYDQCDGSGDERKFVGYLFQRSASGPPKQIAKIERQVKTRHFPAAECQNEQDAGGAIQGGQDLEETDEPVKAKEVLTELLEMRAAMMATCAKTQSCNRVCPLASGTD